MSLSDNVVVTMEFGYCSRVTMRLEMHFNEPPVSSSQAKLVLV